MNLFEFRYSPGNSITIVYKTKFIISQKGNQLAVLDGYFYRAGSITNKPGMAQVGAICKAQKHSKTTFSTTGYNKSSQKTQN